MTARDVEAVTQRISNLESMVYSLMTKDEKRTIDFDDPNDQIANSVSAKVREAMELLEEKQSIEDYHNEKILDMCMPYLVRQETVSSRIISPGNIGSPFGMKSSEWGIIIPPQQSDFKCKFTRISKDDQSNSQVYNNTLFKNGKVYNTFKDIRVKLTNQFINKRIDTDDIYETYEMQKDEISPSDEISLTFKNDKLTSQIGTDSTELASIDPTNWTYIRFALEKGKDNATQLGSHLTVYKTEIYVEQKNESYLSTFTVMRSKKEMSKFTIFFLSGYSYSCDISTDDELLYPTLVGVHSNILYSKDNAFSIHPTDYMTVTTQHSSEIELFTQAGDVTKFAILSKIDNKINQLLKGSGQDTIPDAILGVQRSVVSLYNLVPKLNTTVIGKISLKANVGLLRRTVTWVKDYSESGPVDINWKEKTISTKTTVTNYEGLDSRSSTSANGMLITTVSDPTDSTHQTKGWVKVQTFSTENTRISSDVTSTGILDTIHYAFILRVQKQEWQGTVGESSDTTITYKFRGETKTIPVVYSTKVLSDGVIMFETKPIELARGSDNMEARKNNFNHDMTPGTSFANGSSGGLGVAIIMNSDASRTHELQVAPSTYTTVKPEEVEIIDIAGKFTILRNPTNEVPEFINTHDASQDAAISQIANAIEDITTQLNDVESRVKAIEKSLETSVLKTIGTISMGFIGAIPGVGAIVAFTAISIISFGIDAVAHDDAESGINAIVMSIFVSMAGLYKVSGTITNKMVDWIERLKNYVSDISLPSGTRPKWLKLDAARLKSKLFPNIFNKSKKAFAWNSEYNTPLELLMGGDYVCVKHSPLAFPEVDVSKLINENSISGTLYRTATKRNLAPAHADLLLSHNYHVLEEGFENTNVRVLAKFGVGNGFNEELATTKFNQILFPDEHKGAGILNVFSRVDEKTGVESIFRFDPNIATQEQLEREARYYYKHYLGGQFEEDDIDAFVKMKPWLAKEGEGDMSWFYDSAYDEIKAAINSGDMVLDPKTLTEIGLPPQAIGMLYSGFGEGYMKNNFIYDVLGNNCQDVAYGMHSLITKAKVERVSKHMETSWMAQMDRNISKTRTGYKPGERLQLSEIYEMMDDFFRSTETYTAHRPSPLETFSPETDAYSLNKKKHISHSVSLASRLNLRSIVNISI